MVIYGLSDLHLSFSTNKPMDIFHGWENYVSRIESNWRRIVKEDDVVVLPGDFSWALKLEETKKDFEFLESLPGKKILLKGNHDLWWSTSKKVHEFFNKEKFNSVDIVFNNAYIVGKYAICGTRGWIKEKESDEKILRREALRLETSLNEAEKAKKIPIVFLHYPLIYKENCSAELLNILKKHNISMVYHGHIHGVGNNYIKEYDGISFKLLSCDCINFTPFQIIETFL